MGNTNQTQQNPVTIHQNNEELSNFTCEICIEPVTSPNTKFNNNNKCMHPFCTECMIKYIQVKLDENVSDIKCPALTCDHCLDPLACRAKIDQKLFDKWCDVLCESALLSFEGVYCPNRECSALVVNECGGGDNLKRCVCLHCKKPFCYQCKVAWHAGYTCEETGEITDANDIEFGVLSESKKWMRCPVCRHFVERLGGCSIVRCRCGIEFCYKCGKKVDHDHRCNLKENMADHHRRENMADHYRCTCWGAPLWCSLLTICICIVPAYILVSRSNGHCIDHDDYMGYSYNSSFNYCY